MLPVGLVRGCFPRDFPTAALRAAPPFPFVLLSPPPGRTSFFTIRPGQRCRTSTFPFTQTGGQSLPFSTFSPRARVMLLPLPCRPPSDTACARRGGASRWARPRRLSTGFSNGGAARSAAVPFCPSFPRPPGRTSFFTQPPGQRYRARSPRRCSPKGSSKVAFCGILQGRRGGASRWARLRRASPRGIFQCRQGDASRWARPRRLSAGFSNAAEAVLAEGARLRRPSTGFCRGRRGDASPMGSSEAAFCGVLQSRRGDGFPLGSSETASHGIFQRRRCAQRRRSLLSFSPPPPGPYFFLYPAVLPAMPRATFPASICPAGRQGQRRFLCRLHGRRSSALPFRPIGGAPGTAPLFLHPAARGTDAARPFPPMRTGGQSLPFSTFSRAPESCFFLYPARPANDTAHGRRGDARQRARPRRLSAGFCRAAAAVLPVGLVRGGFPRGFPTAALRAAPPFPFVLLSPATRERMPRARSRPCEPAGSPFPFHIFLPPVVLLSLPSRPASDTAHGRRGDASRWGSSEAAFAGFCRAAEAMLPVGLV